MTPTEDQVSKPWWNYWPQRVLFCPCGQVSCWFCKVIRVAYMLLAAECVLVLVLVVYERMLR